MSILIEVDGEDHEVYARWSGGMIDAILRASSKEAWQQAAINRELLWQDEDGAIHPGRGVVITELGPYVITPGEYDEDGNETKAPVLDTRWHVNIRLYGFGLRRRDDDGRIMWEDTVLLWTQQGEVVTDVNAAESARKLYEVELIDPDSTNGLRRTIL